jgi:hypothetical protein
MRPAGSYDQLASLAGRPGRAADRKLSAPDAVGGVSYGGAGLPVLGLLTVSMVVVLARLFSCASRRSFGVTTCTNAGGFACRELTSVTHQARWRADTAVPREPSKRSHDVSTLPRRHGSRPGSQVD